MSKKPESRLSHRSYQLALSTVVAQIVMATILLAASPGAADPIQVTEDPVWVGLGSPADYTHLCQQDDTGTWICDNTCPQGTSSICAELTTPAGTVLRTCCIFLEDEGSSDPFACLVDVQLIRDDEMPEEVYLG